MNELNARLANGIFFSLAGSIASQGLTLLAAIPVARLLDTRGYGELGIIQSTLMLFTLFSGPSLGQTATKYVAELRLKDTERVGRIIGLTNLVGVAMSALMGLSLYIAAPLLASRVLNLPPLAPSLQIAVGVLFLNSINGVQIGVLSGFEAFDSIAKIAFVRGLVTLPLLIAGAYWGGVSGVVGALVVVWLITVLMTQRMLMNLTRRYGIAIRYRQAGREWQILWAFYLPTVLSGIVSMPAAWLANAFLVNTPNGYAEMGIFNAADQWRAAVLFLPATVSQPMLPILSNLYGGNAISSFVKTLRVNLVLAVGTTLIPALFIAAASRLIMQAYGEGFSQGSNVLAVLVLTSVLSSTPAVIGTAISSVGKRWHATGLNLIWAAAFLLVSRSLVHYGAMGLALAYLISYLIHLFTVGAYTLLSLRPMLRRVQWR